MSLHMVLPWDYGIGITYDRAQGDWARWGVSVPFAHVGVEIWSVGTVWDSFGEAHWWIFVITSQSAVLLGLRGDEMEALTLPPPMVNC